jgi:HK97 family phage portal protein
MSPVVLSSAINDVSQIKALKEFTESFELDNAGANNAGKVIKLPPGMRLDAINYKLIDADIINTLKFTNSEIISAFGVPSFLMSYETTQSIENQTLEFKTFALNSILAAYKNEIEMKMLTSTEIEQGVYIDFDYSVLLDADLTTKAQAYQLLATNGLITPNEAIINLGLGSTIKTEGGDKHYLQMQYTPLENREQNPLENKTDE